MPSLLCILELAIIAKNIFKTSIDAMNDLYIHPSRVINFAMYYYLLYLYSFIYGLYLLTTVSRVKYETPTPYNGMISETIKSDINYENASSS